MENKLRVTRGELGGRWGKLMMGKSMIGIKEYTFAEKKERERKEEEEEEGRGRRKMLLF